MEAAAKHRRVQHARRAAQRFQPRPQRFAFHQQELAFHVTCVFSSVGVPMATMRPRSISTRRLQYSASSM